LRIARSAFMRFLAAAEPLTKRDPERARFPLAWRDPLDDFVRDFPAERARFVFRAAEAAVAFRFFFRPVDVPRARL
jgi:hypothetical protein